MGGVEARERLEAFPHPGMRTIAQIGGDAAGRVVFSLQNGIADPDHPWATRLRYRNQWIATVYPGFINGIDPIYKPAQATDSLKAGLCSFPDIPLNSWDDPIGGSWVIPPFFKNMGCVPPLLEKISYDTDLSSLGSVTITQAETQPVDARDIARSQIWVSQARATFKMEVDVPGNILTGDLVNYTVTYNMQSLRSLGSRPFIQSGAQMPKPQTTSLEDRLAGAYGDSGVDTVLLASIYFVSLPRNHPNYSDTVNDRWIPFVVHHQFWNLAYAQKNIMPVSLPPFGLPPSLASFLGRYVFPGAIIGAQTSLESQIFAAVSNSRDLTGTFYTI